MFQGNDREDSEVAECDTTGPSLTHYLHYFYKGVDFKYVIFVKATVFVKDDYKKLIIFGSSGGVKSIP